MKKKDKKDVLKDSLFNRPFDSNVDMGGVIAFAIIALLLALIVLTLTVIKLFE